MHSSLFLTFSASLRYPCVPLVIATWNPEEGEITEHLTDRIAMSLSADDYALSVQQRVDAVTNVIHFSGDVEDRDLPEYRVKELAAFEEDRKLRKTIASARRGLPDVKISREQILYLCEEATRAGCVGQRGEIFATHLATACAAVNGRREVNAKDLQTAVRLAIAPRSKYILEEVESTREEERGPRDSFADEMTPLPPPPGDMESGEMKEQEEQSNEKQEDIVDEQDQDQQGSSDEHNEEEIIAIPEEFMFGVNMIPIDPNLLTFMQRTKKGRGGKRSRLYNLLRGR